MPAKSRRKRGKNLPPGKRIKPAAGSSNAAVVTQSEVQPAGPAPAASVPVSGRRSVNAMAQAQAISHRYISSELVSIAIISVVVLAILGILAAIF